MTSNRIFRVFVILIALSALFLVLTIGFAVYAYYQSINAPVNIIKGQLKALNEGRIKNAYNQFTAADFRKKTSLENFTNLVEANPQIFNSKSVQIEKIRINDNKAVVTCTIVGQDGTETPMTYTLICQEGKWLIAGFRQGTNSVK